MQETAFIGVQIRGLYTLGEGGTAEMDTGPYAVGKMQYYAPRVPGEPLGHVRV